MADQNGDIINLIDIFYLIIFVQSIKLCDMNIRIEITGTLNEEELFKQLNSFGWSQVIENGKTYFALYRNVVVNGKSQDVETFFWEFSFSPNEAVFQSCSMPGGVNLRTGNTVFRVLAGKIVGDLIRNDCLRIKTYSISFQ